MLKIFLKYAGNTFQQVPISLGAGLPGADLTRGQIKQGPI